MNITASVSRHALNTMSVVSPRLAGRFAFSLFCNPLRRAEIRNSEHDVHDRAIVENVAVNGTNVVTYRWGNGERPVLFVHGFESRGSRFAPFVSGLLGASLTAITYDAPGHGASGGVGATILDQHAIAQRLQELHGPFAAIVAHSFGVPCAFFAVKNGVKADRLVSIGGICDFDLLPETFCKLLGLRPAISRELRRRTEALFLPETNIWERFSVSHESGVLGLSVLVIHDQDDREVNVAQATKIAQSLNGQAKVMLTTGLGHRRILTDPDIVSSVVAFVSSVRERGSSL